MDLKEIITFAKGDQKADLLLKNVQLHRTVTEMGCALEDPFMVLSFLALPVIPELKITDKGLVDVAQFKVVSLFGEC